MVIRDNPDFLSASTIKGDKVVNKAGEDLGKIEELMIDLQDGRIGYAVLSFGGFLGMGDKLFAIPWDALALRLHEHAFTLDIPKEVLEKAEGFDKDSWPIASREWLSNVYSYYAYQPYWQAGAMGQTRLTGEAESERATRMESGVGRESPDFLSAGTLKGDKVVNRAGEDLGKVEEFMIDLENGKVAYAVLSRGGFLGMGDKLFAIPWDALALRLHEHAFTLDIPKETFDKAEGFDKDNWPLTRDELSRTYTHYGYQPYWQTGAAEQPEISTGKIEQAEVSAAVLRETETEKMEVVETEEEIKARQERERLEGLRSTQEEKLSQLEKQRMEREKQAQAEKERLAQLERERIEVERQAEAERQRLAQLERELQEARRQEETERVARLEKELREVQTQEETRKEKITQLVRECTEARRQAEVEKEALVQLERERTEVEKRAEVERETLAQLERERTEAEGWVETKPGRGIPDFLSANTIKADRVVNTAGEDLGRIEELMIDLDNGRVAYAVLSFGGFLGMSDKFFAIPWKYLKYRAHEHAFTLDIPKDVLENAEGFDKDKWPLIREELSRTYTYYGYQPYWQREITERAEMLTGETESERMIREEMSEERHRPLEMAEEKMARQDKERIEKQEAIETDKEKRERLEKERVIAERRERKYK